MAVVVNNSCCGHDTSVCLQHFLTFVCPPSCSLTEEHRYHLTWMLHEQLCRATCLAENNIIIIINNRIRIQVFHGMGRCTMNGGSIPTLFPAFSPASSSHPSVVQERWWSWSQPAATTPATSTASSPCSWDRCRRWWGNTWAHSRPTQGWQRPAQVLWYSTFSDKYPCTCQKNITVTSYTLDIEEGQDLWCFGVDTRKVLKSFTSSSPAALTTLFCQIETFLKSPCPLPPLVWASPGLPKQTKRNSPDFRPGANGC